MIRDNYFFNKNEQIILLSKPLKWIQIVSVNKDLIFRIEGCFKDGSYRTAAFLDRSTDEECLKYQKFKQHYLVLNKIKYGELCHYEFNHLNFGCDCDICNKYCCRVSFYY